MSRVPAGARRWMQAMWDDAEQDYRAQILDLVSAWNGVRLLDVGCDDGAWTAALAARVHADPDDVSGLEIVEERRRLAAGRGYDVRAADLDAEWPFADGSFDVVHANQVIEHVTALDHFVTETRRVLRPGGRGIVCTENLASWHNVGALALGWMPFSLSNISDRGSIGNPISLHKGEASAHGSSWQHTRVLSLRGLEDIFRAHDLVVERSFASGYHPARGRAARALARHDPRHAHFIGVVVMRPR